jgi:hypothetical protein
VPKAQQALRGCRVPKAHKAGRELLVLKVVWGRKVFRVV